MKVQQCALVLSVAIVLLAQACRRATLAPPWSQRDEIAVALRRELGSDWRIEVTDGISRGRLPPLDAPGWNFRGVNTNLLWYSAKLRTNVAASFDLYLHPRSAGPPPPPTFAKGHTLCVPFGETKTHFVYGNAVGPHPEVETVRATLRRVLPLLPRSEQTAQPTIE